MAFFQVDREAAASVIYSIAISSPITPTEPLPPLPAIPCGSLVIVEGRAPVVGHGSAPASRLPCRGSCLLRSAPMGGGGSNAQPGVAVEPGAGSDPGAT